jgi:uncharacterized protein (TIGR03083 family)
MPQSQATTWDAATTNFATLLNAIDDWSLDSPCPGWTIADLVSHTIDLEALLAADPRPEHSPDWSSLPHIDSDFGRLTEIGVDYRRGRSRDDLLTELEETHERARARVESLGPDATIPWLRGDTPIKQLLGMRTFDIWMHEQDARVAVDDIGNLDGPGAANAWRYLSAGLPKVWGKNVGAPIGSVLRVSVTEPGMTGECWVRVNEDGKASLVDEQSADVSVTMPWLAFIMLTGGRATETNFAEDVVVVGNQELGRKLIDAMAVTP